MLSEKVVPINENIFVEKIVNTNGIVNIAMHYYMQFQKFITKSSR